MLIALWPGGELTRCGGTGLCCCMAPCVSSVGFFFLEVGFIGDGEPGPRRIGPSAGGDRGRSAWVAAVRAFPSPDAVLAVFFFGKGCAPGELAKLSCCSVSFLCCNLLYCSAVRPMVLAGRAFGAALRGLGPLIIGELGDNGGDMGREKLMLRGVPPGELGAACSGTLARPIDCGLVCR